MFGRYCFFSDLETYSDTKEAYMRKRSSGRIQRYFYDAKEKIRNSPQYAKNAKSRHMLDALMEEFMVQLQKDEYFAFFFDRKCAQRGAICDHNGVFVCQGLWNDERCTYAAGDAPSEHRINPYCSREQRVLFTTWNLDHRWVLFLNFERVFSTPRWTHDFMNSNLLKRIGLIRSCADIVPQ